MIQRPRGTRDFLPEEMFRRRMAELRLREIAERWGYSEVSTPTFEHLELFTMKSGEGIVGELYAFQDKSGRELTLRPEMTAPVTRVFLNELKSAPRPMRFYYFANCFRYERPQKGRFREFWQFGVELIGSDGAHANAEVIALASEMLRSLGIRGDLRINDLSLLRKRLRKLSGEEQNRALRLIDKKSFEELREFLRGKMSVEDIENLIELVSFRGSPEDAEEFGELSGILKELCRILDLYGVEYSVDFGIARGLDYYTGIVFEIYAEGLGAQNQICGGGSYDLASVFSSLSVPSTGFAIGFDRVMEITSISEKPRKPVVLVSTPGLRDEAIRVALKLRGDIPVVTDVMNRSISAQMKYADAIGAKFALILGEREIEEGKILVRDLESGEQEEISFESLLEYLRERV
ncbi:MAG: histidine--tRNA ligase [Archaeoglobi archaeon]|nr:histidine--tRNA ligase [Candidatus Mnemosynella sp.]